MVREEKNHRLITFRIPPKLWEEFSIKCIKEGSNKTKILLSFVKRFLGKK